MISYNEHNAKARGVVISDRLKSGETCALVTDAGTPAVSDPGEELVMLCAEFGIPVTAIPGACAAITAVMLSGLPSSRFAFEGSLGETRQKRLERLGELAHDRRMLVIYEAPHMLRETLTDINTVLGNRRLTLCRELTKQGEEVLRLDVVSAMAYFGQREPRGEYVIVLEGEPEEDGEFWRGLTVAQHVGFYVEKMNISKIDAVKAVARDRGLSKNAVYKELL
jgi:16S rRNA (cytidine1402-2'-O)-methyltransferase